MNTDRLSILIALGMCIIALVGCGNSDGATASIETCEELAPHIIELSEQSADSYPGKILKMYDIKDVIGTGTNDLDCSATGRMSRGDDTTIRFHLVEDADGDRFIGYQVR